jgi:hypothetical protein
MNARYRTMSGIVAGLIVVAAADAALGQEKVAGTVAEVIVKKCTMKPGECEGSVAIGEPGHTRTFQVKPGVTSITKAGKPIIIESVHPGDRVTVEVAALAEKDVARMIAVTASTDHSTPADHHEPSSSH